MRTLSVNEVRQRFSEILRDAQAGDSITITRYGQPIAQINPIQDKRPKFPDLSEFRASIETQGLPLSDIVLQMRKDQRF